MSTALATSTNFAQPAKVRGDWFVVPASEDIVFHDDPYVVWELLMRQVYESNRIVPNCSKNPELN